MLIIIIVLVSLVLLIIGHELGHFFAAKSFKIDVPEFGLGFPPRITAKKIGKTEYSLNWLPFGGFVKIRGEDEIVEVEGVEPAPISEESKRGSLAYQPAWKKSVVILAGAVINFIIGWLLISSVFMIGTPPLVAVTSVSPDSPAAAAGFQAGDIIEGYTSADQLVSDINAHKGGDIMLDVMRGSETVHLTATPRINPEPGQGAIGVALAEGGVARENPLFALWDGLLTAGSIAWATIGGFVALIASALRHGKLPSDVVGPVGIVSVAKQAGQFGLIYLVQLLSVISINLAILNLIPFPALDGGRFLLIMIGKIKGSPVSARIEGILNAVGFVALIALMLAVTTRDVSRLF